MSSGVAQYKNILQVNQKKVISILNLSHGYKAALSNAWLKTFFRPAGACCLREVPAGHDNNICGFTSIVICIPDESGAAMVPAILSLHFHGNRSDLHALFPVQFRVQCCINIQGR